MSSSDLEFRPIAAHRAPCRLSAAQTPQLGKEYLREAIGMSADDGNVAGGRLLVVEWCILLYRKMEHVFLLTCGSSWIFSYVLTREDMFLDMEEMGGHVQDSQHRSIQGSGPDMAKRYIKGQDDVA